MEVISMERKLATEEIGWLSLALCIFKPLTVEDAFQIIAPDPEAPKSRELCRQQTEEMFKLKGQGMTCAAIADLYGVSIDTVRGRLKRYREKIQAS